MQAKPYCLRIIGPNCLGIAVPGIGLHANFGLNRPASRQARLSVAIRRADHRHSRLGRGARHRLLLCRVDGRHGGCRCRRPARFPRRRHRDPVHPALSRDHPRRAEIHVGGEIGRARQAGHRHQVGPLSGIGAGRGHAYRRAGRQRCGRRRGLPPGRPGAGRGAGGAVRGGRDADLAEARGRQRADDPDQWRRRRRARGRRSDPIGRPARTAERRRHRRTRQGAARQLVASKSRRHHRRRGAQALRGRARCAASQAARPTPCS